MNATLNDSRHIATHILENAQPEQVNAICYYARILSSGTGEMPFAVIRNFILAIVNGAPPAYARFVCDMTDQERTLFDNMIAKAVLMGKQARR